MSKKEKENCYFKIIQMICYYKKENFKDKKEKEIKKC